MVIRSEMVDTAAGFSVDPCPDSNVYAVSLAHPADFAGWREACRQLLASHVPPHQVIWRDADPSADLFAARETATAAPESDANHRGLPQPRPFTVPRQFLELAERVCCHRDPQRFGLLYRLLWRYAQGESCLLEQTSDDDVYRAQRFAKAVARDCHKMRAFVRFRRAPARLASADAPYYHAWFEPDHHIVRYNSGFFRRRFATMNWSIATPDESVHWNGSRLAFGAPVPRADLPRAEPVEALWRTYFGSVFNPARLRVNAMLAEMPVKYWKNLPEAELISPLVAAAGQRTASMVDAQARPAPRYAIKAAATLPPTAELKRSSAPSTPAELARAVDACALCAHACHATQGVAGQGPADARVMIVGEQPGDREDLRGRPFVGPAGQVLRELLDELNVPVNELYMTNAVKHFKYTVRGKRRLHQRPSADDVANCRPWLLQELKLVQPRLVIALGATAGRALIGYPVKVQTHRGKLQPLHAECHWMLTLHPAFVVRQRSTGDRERARSTLAHDLAMALSVAGYGP